MAEAQLIVVDGTSRELVHSFTPDRAIASLEGLFLLVDRKDGAWTESDTPASAEEMLVLKPLVDGSPDTLTITQDGADGPPAYLGRRAGDPEKGGGE